MKLSKSREWQLHTRPVEQLNKQLIGQFAGQLSRQLNAQFYRLLDWHLDKRLYWYYYWELNGQLYVNLREYIYGTK